MLRNAGIAVPRPADLGDPGTDGGAATVWGKDVPGVPVVLVPGVEDVPQVGTTCGGSGSPVNAGALARPCEIFTPSSVSMAGTQGSSRTGRRFERVALGSNVWAPPCAGQPEQDERRRGLGWLVGSAPGPAGLAGGQGGQGCGNSCHPSKSRLQVFRPKDRVSWEDLLTGSVETRELRAPQSRSARPLEPGAGDEPRPPPLVGVGRRPRVLW
jgi:hypothetical protein